MATQLVSRLPQSFRLFSLTKQFSLGASLSAKTEPSEDPVKKLFLDKIKDYRAKSKGDKLPDVTPAAMKELSEELGRLKRIHGDGDLSKFPSFEFKDPSQS